MSVFARIGDQLSGHLKCLIETYSQEYRDLIHSVTIEGDCEEKTYPTTFGEVNKTGKVKGNIMKILVHQEELRFLENVIRDLVHLHNKNVVNHKYDLDIEELLDLVHARKLSKIMKYFTKHGITLSKDI